MKSIELRCKIDEDVTRIDVASETLLRGGSLHWNYFQSYCVQINGFSLHGKISEPGHRTQGGNYLLVSPELGEILQITNRSVATIQISRKDPVREIQYELAEDGADAIPVLEGIEVQEGGRYHFKGDLIKITGCYPTSGYITIETKWKNSNPKDEGLGKPQTLGQRKLDDTITGLDRLAGKDEQMLSNIQRKVIYPLQHPEFTKKHQLEPINGLLICAPCGMGKDTIASAIAEELDWPILQLGAGENPTPDLVNEIYKQASSKEGCLIIIDGLSTLDGETNNTPAWIFSLQNCLDESRGNNKILTIGLARHQRSLPRSLRRIGRMEITFTITLPNRQQRAELLRHFLSPLLKADTVVDYQLLADYTEGFRPAALEHVAKQFGLQALTETGSDFPNKKITTEAILGFMKQSTAIGRNI
ncbi:AAA family ATPase [Fodinibius sp. AD559]|uniref:AAA family ATPase n=1 Tax=Fodinibius sp. AD559 TaxID=3424179 RepID=UPI004046AD23